MFRRILTIFTLVAVMLSVTAVTLAQDAGEVIAEGLRNPRNMSYDSEGNLYVAEAGVAGDLVNSAGAAFGATSGVTRIDADGTMRPVVTGLISSRAGDSLGASDIIVTDTSYWVLIGEVDDEAIPYSHALMEIDREHGRIVTWVDLLELELEEDPDGNPNGQSNPVDIMLMDDGSIMIVNAGCNCLMQWSADAGLSVAAAWDFETDNPVPTSVDLGPDGDLYVGFLTGFPFPEEGARIERWSDGELAETYTGLTGVTNVLVTDDGTIYAVERGVFDMASGWSNGRVVQVSMDGITPVLEGLNLPYGLVQAPDGDFIVSTGTSGGADGALIKFSAP